MKDPAGRPRLLTSASSFGRLFTETDLVYRRPRARHRPRVGAGLQRAGEQGRHARPGETSLIDLYKKLVTPIASNVIGHVTSDVTAAQNAAGESALGDLIADAQLADPSVVTGGQKPVIAFMNPGGIRTDLTATNSKYGEPTGDVTYEEAFNVQPFNNYLVSMTLTGQQIYDLLAQQVTGANAASRKVAAGLAGVQLPARAVRPRSSAP